MVDNQKLEQILAKIGVRLFSKVNAAEKFGVDFFNFGVLTETRKGAKNARKTCTKTWVVCKN